jgi:hypothetical protein
MKRIIWVVAMLSVVSCGGGGNSGNDDCDLQCSTPPSGKFCLSGQLFDTENSQPILSESLIEITLYDGLQFAQNPTIAVPLPVESLTISSCGQFLAQGVTLPALGYVALATDDSVDGADEYIHTGVVYPVTADSQMDGINLFATRYSTDEQWVSSASSPFGSSAFYEVGAFVPVFMHQDVPVDGVTITVSDIIYTDDDYYFSNTTSDSRTTIDTALTETGVNGTGIIVSSSMVNHSGSGSEPSGCEWPSVLAKSIPGVLMVQELNSVQPGTDTVCE